MAKPRIFISSTYYDLKHLRSSLENFIESLGFEPVLSEKGDIAYAPDMPLDDSCYREARSADIFVLIIGGRYGSESSGQEKRPTKAFLDRYDSITKQEYKSAVSQEVPTYILVESSVYSEYRTFLKNKGNKDVVYVHVDSVNVFHLIEEILSQPKNNPVYPFERYAEVEDWLREQWAGLFKDLLTRMSSQQQISSLSTKVSELGEINVTLRRYLETIIEKVSPKESESIIELESKRLRETLVLQELKGNRFCRFLTREGKLPFEDSVKAVRIAKSFENLAELLSIREGEGERRTDIFTDTVLSNTDAQNDINEARGLLGLKPFRMKKSNKAMDSDEG